jgi:hypothetical protein
MTRRLSVWFGAGCMLAGLLLPVHAQNLLAANPQEGHQAFANQDTDAVPERIAQERHTLSVQKAAVLQGYEKQTASCWNKFAVNACLLEARRARRQALEPLTQQELALNAQERAWRTEQRDKRLQEKQPENRGSP